MHLLRGKLLLPARASECELRAEGPLVRRGAPWIRRPVGFGMRASGMWHKGGPKARWSGEKRCGLGCAIARCGPWNGRPEGPLRALACAHLACAIRVSVRLPLSLSACLSVCLSPPPSISLSFSVSLFLSLRLIRLFLCLCLSLSYSLCVYDYLSICLSLSLSVCLSVCLSVSLSLSLSVSLSLSASVSAPTSLSLSLCLSLSVCLSLCLSPSVCVCVSVCLSASACLSLCLGGLYVSLCPPPLPPLSLSCRDSLKDAKRKAPEEMQAPRTFRSAWLLQSRHRRPSDVQQQPFKMRTTEKEAGRVVTV